MLSSVPNTDTVIVADLEAGIGTLTRLPDAAVDITLVVVEPTPRSIDVGKRAVLAANEHRQGRVMVIANKASDTDDEHRVRDAFPDQTVLAVPHDPAVVSADRLGLSPVDHDPHSPAVAALRTHAAALLSG